MQCEPPPPGKKAFSATRALAHIGTVVGVAVVVVVVVVAVVVVVVVAVVVVP